MAPFFGKGFRNQSAPQIWKNVEQQWARKLGHLDGKNSQMERKLILWPVSWFEERKSRINHEREKIRHKMASANTLQFESNPTLPWTQNSFHIKYSLFQKKSFGFHEVRKEFVSTPPLGRTQIPASVGCTFCVQVQVDFDTYAQ